MELSLEEFKALIEQWKESIEMEKKVSLSGIDLDEFIQPFYRTMEMLAEKIFADKIDDIFEYLYSDLEMPIEEFYNSIFGDK